MQWVRHFVSSETRCSRAYNARNNERGSVGKENERRVSKTTEVQKWCTKTNATTTYCHKKKGINENAEGRAFNLGHDRSELLNSIAKRLAASVNGIGTSDE